MRIEDGKLTGCWLYSSISAKAWRRWNHEYAYGGMGIWKCICQNENMVRLVNIFIGNISTPLPKKGDFCLIDDNYYRTAHNPRVRMRAVQSWSWRSLWRGGSDGLDWWWKWSEPWQALSCRVNSRGKSRGRPARRRLDDVKELTDWGCVRYGKRQRIVCYADSVSGVKPQRIDYRGDRGELTHFSLKTIVYQNGTSLLNYVGMLVFHAISHVS